MKRTRILSVVALAVGCAIAVHNTGAQPPADGQSVEQAEQNNRKAEERATVFVKKALETAEGRSEVRQSLRDKVRPLVEESFNARQGLQRAQLEALRRRLAEIEQAIQDREKNKQAIIDARTDELITSGTALETSKNQRLSQLDLQQAEAEYAASQEELSRVRKLHETGAVTDTVLQAAEKKASDAGLKLQGLAVKFDVFSDPVVVSGPVPTAPASDVRDGSPTPQPSPDAKYRVRYIQEQATEDGKPVTRMVPVYERIGLNQLTTYPANLPTGTVGAGEGGPDAQPQSAFGGNLDLDSRERLVKLDLQAAEEELDAAKSSLNYVRANFKTGRTTQSELRNAEKQQRLAELELQRAKVKLEGLSRQHTELEAIADAAVAEASAEVQKAAAGVGIAQANREAADAEVQRAEADVEAAEANHKYQGKQYERFKKLVEDRAIDSSLLAEREDQLGKAEAALKAAKSALSAAKAHRNQTASAIAEAQAASNVAAIRVRAAEAHRDRLKQHPAPDKPKAEPESESEEDAK